MTWILAIDATWAGLIGALGGVLITSLVALGTALLNHRWGEATQREERASRLRESKATLRLTSYTRFLVAAEVIGETVGGHSAMDPSTTSQERLNLLRNESPAMFTEFDAAVQQLRLVGGEAVVRELNEFITWLQGAIERRLLETPEAESFLAPWDVKEAPLITEMRKEQEVDLAAPHS